MLQPIRSANAYMDGKLERTFTFHTLGGVTKPITSDVEGLEEMLDCYDQFQWRVRSFWNPWREDVFDCLHEES